MFCVIGEFCLGSVLLMFLLPLRDTLTPIVASAVFEFALGTFSTASSPRRKFLGRAHNPSELGPRHGTIFTLLYEKHPMVNAAFSPCCNHFLSHLRDLCSCRRGLVFLA